MSVLTVPHLSGATSNRLARAFLVAMCAFSISVVGAQQIPTDTVPPPQDTPYPGIISLHVDASDTRQGIFRVQETIPVKAGAFTLLYPQWIPGNHSPTGPVAMMAGLTIKADGNALKWRRDKYNVYAFHLDVPEGATALDVQFQYLSPRDGGFEITNLMMDMDWSKMALYPAGHFTRGIMVKPSVSMAAGWQLGTALEVASTTDNTTTFKPVSFDHLVDSPIYAGRHFKRVDLNPGGSPPVHLNIVADAPKNLAMTPEQLGLHRALVTQALRLFGSYHYDHYDFLFSLSDVLAGNGTEHHQSSENGMDSYYFTAWADNAPGRDLLAHEYTHSWNGKFRRPADLWTPNFNVPMGDSLLWLCEGQTQYWGLVLTARSGLWTPEQFRGQLAIDAAKYERGRPGFAWRTLEDTTNDATAAHRQGLPYRSWQMSEEYYSGAQMLWWAADAKIRALTHGKKSLDDFSQAFFGVDNGSYITNTYEFDDVVAALNAVVAYDRAEFLRARVDARDPPLTDGLAAAGWKLVYTDQPTEYEQQYMSRPESARHMYNFIWSIGLSITKGDVINDVLWNGPAFKAGVSSGATVVAVNGKDYTRDVLARCHRARQGQQGADPAAAQLPGRASHHAGGSPRRPAIPAPGSDRRHVGLFERDHQTAQVEPKLPGRMGRPLA